MCIRDRDTLYPVDVRAIKRPSQPFFPLFRFLRKVIKLRKSGTPLPRAPWVEAEDLCTHCGLCVVRCPAGAITKGDELHTDCLLYTSTLFPGLVVDGFFRQDGGEAGQRIERRANFMAHVCLLYTSRCV